MGSDVENIVVVLLCLMIVIQILELWMNHMTLGRNNQTLMRDESLWRERAQKYEKENMELARAMTRIALSKHPKLTIDATGVKVVMPEGWEKKDMELPQP